MGPHIAGWLLLAGFLAAMVAPRARPALIKEPNELIKKKLVQEKN